MSADFGRVLIKDGELLAVAPAAEIGVLYVIPNTVTKISASFAGYKKLEIVRIPDSVIKINQYAFAGCWNLHRIVVSSEERVRYFKEQLIESSGKLLTLE